MKDNIFNERPECQDRLIKFLEGLGYEYVSRSEAETKRGKLSNVLFEDELIRFLKKQTYKFNNNEFLFSGDSISKAVRALDVSLFQGMSSASKEIYDLLTLGKSLEESITFDRNEPLRQSFDINYIDFENPANNIWQVTEEFSVERSNGQYARPDIIILVNGIPLVVIECKKSAVSVEEGVAQNVRNMQPDYIQDLFKYTQLVLAVNPNTVKYGTCGTGKNYFVEWREDDIDWNNEICKNIVSTNKIFNDEVLEQDRICASLLDKKRLLDIIKNFILYDSNIKKIARHQQFFAVNKTIARIKGEDNKTVKGGVIWHTQGSGKSLTMVMLVKKIIASGITPNPRFILVTDRINLDKQIKDNFVNTRMAPIRATTGKSLGEILKDKNSIVTTTLINKFENVCKNRYLEPNSDSFYVLVDEAHRSQYSSMYNYMKKVLPNANFIAFTGTPLISKSKKNTYKRFGEAIHNYTMKDAIVDKITVPIVYEGRKIVQNSPSNTINEYFDSLTQELSDEQKKELKNKYSKYSKLKEAKTRLDLIALDIYDHFINYCLPRKMKAMIACSSRAQCVELYDSLKTMPSINPKVVITFGNNEGEDDDNTNTALSKISDYHREVVKPMFGENNDKYDEYVTEDFKNPEGETNILIVKDKLLTGFDAPIAGVLYLDKSIKDHNLLQAIARINRVNDNKTYGLVIDYYGVFTKLKSAIDMYDDALSNFNEFDKEDIESTIFGVADGKKKLDEAFDNLVSLFMLLEDKNSSNAWQTFLENTEKREEFYKKLRDYEEILSLALINRELFNEIGLEKLHKYQKDLKFYTKLKASVAMRYDEKDTLDAYNESLKNLLDTFVIASEIQTVVDPTSITDENAMEKALELFDNNQARADIIKTRVESELKQKRFEDPLLFEEFSIKIKKTLDEYNDSRDADKYYTQMCNIENDMKNGIMNTNYPKKIINDTDAKAFYGSVVSVINDCVDVSIELEEKIADISLEIKNIIKNNTKRDWKSNEIVHRSIHRELDDILFDLFDDVGYNIDDSNVEIIDLIIDNIMKIAVSKY